ncbi:diphthamide biosynthesis enzyme Dph1/Dph2 domain protein [Cryptosporidium felis]|nr:diphthamide biosynthesis enzyme Dph1/Dph2 domain protein [Cryptosporidium felis]
MLFDMDSKLNLGRYSKSDCTKVSEWILNYSAGRKLLVVALQFSTFDVKFAPSIQLYIESQINSIKTKIQPQEDCKIRLFILSDIVNPACCLDVLNIKKAHSNLVVHFGYCCYHNTRQYKLPVYYVPSLDHYFPFDDKKEQLLIKISKFLYLRVSEALQDDESRFPNKVKIILSFHGILKSEFASKIEDAINKLILTEFKDNVKTYFYLLSPQMTTDNLDIEDMEFICDIFLKKMGHEENLNVEFTERRNIDKPIQNCLTERFFFFHFVFGDHTYDNLPNSFIERVFIRYNQIFEFFLCSIDLSNCDIKYNSDLVKEMDSIISKRFISIEKAVSINNFNTVAFIITPGITPKEWNLVEVLKSYKYRRDIDNGKKILIESHLIALAGINEVKLNNFPKIDIFCYFGCPEYFRTFVIKTLNLKSHIILTPYEYEIFLGIREWSTAHLEPFELCNSRSKFGISQQSDLDSGSESSDLDRELERLALEEPTNLGKETLSERSKFGSLNKIDKSTKELLVRLHSNKRIHEHTFYGLNPFESTDKIPQITDGKDGVASAYRNETKNLL